MLFELTSNGCQFGRLRWTITCAFGEAFLSGELPFPSETCRQHDIPGICFMSQFSFSKRYADPKSFRTLLDLIMLDTRQYDRSITDLYWNTHYVHQISDDAGRSMMGSRQENWFYSQLKASAKRAATWRVIGSQTVFSRINESIAYGNVDPLDYDAWVRALLQLFIPWLMQEHPICFPLNC